MKNEKRMDLDGKKIESKKRDGQILEKDGKGEKERKGMEKKV